MAEFIAVQNHLPVAAEFQPKLYFEDSTFSSSLPLAPRENPEQMPTMFVAVESIDDYISKGQQLGAKIMKNKQEIDAGYYAVMEDTQKNTFGIWQDK